MIRLAKSLTDTLVSQPETGMGWQLIEARIGAGKPYHVFVLNGQLVLEARGYVQLLREATDVEKRTLSLQLEHPSPDLRVRTLSLQESRDLGLVAKRPYAAGRGPAAEAPAVHRFHLGPPEPIPVRRGVVEPAFGHQGGGAEVIFQKGAPRGTKYKQDTIPSGMEGKR